VIYDVDPLRTSELQGFFLFYDKELQTTGVAKFGGLQCLTTMLLFPGLTVVKGLPSPEQILRLKFDLVVINHDRCGNHSATSLELSITTQVFSQCPSGTL
jgi:hypothetical protein